MQHDFFILDVEGAICQRGKPLTNQKCEQMVARHIVGT